MLVAVIVIAMTVHVSVLDPIEMTMLVEVGRFVGCVLVFVFHREI